MWRNQAKSSLAAASCSVPKEGTKLILVLPWELLGRAQDPAASLPRPEVPQPRDTSPSLSGTHAAGAGSVWSAVKPCVVLESSDAAGNGEGRNSAVWMRQSQGDGRGDAVPVLEAEG